MALTIIILPTTANPAGIDAAAMALPAKFFLSALLNVDVISL
jgi:hypothetical protein